MLTSTVVSVNGDMKTNCSTAFLRYASLFHRKEEEHNNDVDVFQTQNGQFLPSTYREKRVLGLKQSGGKSRFTDSTPLLKSLKIAAFRF